MRAKMRETATNARVSRKMRETGHVCRPSIDLRLMFSYWVLHTSNTVTVL
jgi:hypothetical protein